MEICRRILLFVFIGSTAMASDSQKPKVLATASIWYDMAKVLAGEFISLDLIVPVGSDPHLYEPTPSDIKKVLEAQVILVNGLNFETWLQKLIQSSGTRARQVILTEGIDAIANPQFKNATDPHAWMDAENGKTYAKNIYEALQTLLPLHRDELEFNFKLYLQQLDETHQYILKKIETIPQRQRILITSHDAFQYYGRKYGLRVESLLGISTEADVQTRDFIRINQVIRDNKIPAIFTETTINPKMMELLSKENDIVIGGALYSDSLGDEKSGADSYINMLRYNTDLISKALAVKADSTAPPKSSPSVSLKLILVGLVVVSVLLGAIYLMLKKIPQ